MAEDIIIPRGDAREDIAAREKIIKDFYLKWRETNPTQRKFNVSLKDYINIKMVSVIETAEHAAKTYLSTLAVLQLDAILTNARKVKIIQTDWRAKNQNPFEKMIVMNYRCTGIGLVKMTVGIKRSNKEKVQYCITAMQIE